MKKLLVIFAMLALVATLVACGTVADTTPADNNNWIWVAAAASAVVIVAIVVVVIKKKK